jgi:small subunit ribosomal protein S6
MFLIDSAYAASDWDGVIGSITRILERVEAEIVSIQKWDERKLAYPVDGKTRGTYILCYFRVDGPKIQEIEKAVQLSEQIMRVLILNAERMTQEDMEKDTPAAKAEKEKDKRRDDAAESDKDADVGQMSDDRDDKQDDDDRQNLDETEESQESQTDPVAEVSLQEQPELSKVEDSEPGQVEDVQGADEQEQLKP